MIENRVCCREIRQSSRADGDRKRASRYALSIVVSAGHRNCRLMRLLRHEVDSLLTPLYRRHAGLPARQLAGTGRHGSSTVGVKSRAIIVGPSQQQSAPCGAYRRCAVATRAPPRGRALSLRIIFVGAAAKWRSRGRNARRAAMMAPIYIGVADGGDVGGRRVSDAAPARHRRLKINRYGGVGDELARATASSVSAAAPSGCFRRLRHIIVSQQANCRR